MIELQPLYTLYHLFIPARSSISCRLPQALSCQRLGLLWGQRSFGTSRVSNHSVCDNHLIINLARLITYTFLSEIRSQIFCQGRATAVTDAGLDQCPKVIKIGQCNHEITLRLHYPIWEPVRSSDHTVVPCAPVQCCTVTKLLTRKQRHIIHRPLSHARVRERTAQIPLSYQGSSRAVRGCRTKFRTLEFQNKVSRTFTTHLFLEVQLKGFFFGSIITRRYKSKSTTR